MAFKGTHEKVRENGENKTRLISDFCLSNNNLKHSMWPDMELIDRHCEDLERLNASVNTKGINIFLEWSTGADLDIHAKCGCGRWTVNSSEIYCKEPTCDMKRDHDTRSGKNNRKAKEHITFSNPSELVGKELGVYVQNYLSQGAKRTV
mmetsp:Transcript_33682/g.41527  ORF Transcript_33682/g.41527 Transcript_33682/m.41527 type:complete len:149 (+) Transcript_33682:118-564(+)